MSEQTAGGITYMDAAGANERLKLRLLERREGRLLMSGLAHRVSVGRVFAFSPQGRGNRVQCCVSVAAKHHSNKALEAVVSDTNRPVGAALNATSRPAKRDTRHLCLGRQVLKAETRSAEREPTSDCRP